jgi:hypothetical protein
VSAVHRGRALIYALFALVVGGLSYVIGVGSWLGQRAEASVLDASDFTFDPPAPLSLVSVPFLAVSFVVIGLLAWMFRGLGRALWFVLFGAAAIATSQLLKQQLLVRPELFEFDAPNTFPSGHMTVFAVIAAGLIWAAPAGLRGVTGVIGAVTMGTAAWQLLEYGWHRPSDVLGAQALAVLAFALAAALRLPSRGRAARGPRSAASLALTKILGVVLTVTGIALIAGGVLMALFAAQIGSDALMLAASEVSVAGASAITARVLMAIST